MKTQESVTLAKSPTRNNRAAGRLAGRRVERSRLKLIRRRFFASRDEEENTEQTEITEQTEKNKTDRFFSFVPLFPFVPYSPPLPGLSRY
jgi:hypothetical protein